MDAQVGREQGYRSQLRGSQPQKFRGDRHIRNHGQPVSAFVHLLHGAQLHLVVVDHEAGKVSTDRGRGLNRRCRRSPPRFRQHETLVVIPNGNRAMAKVLVGGAGDFSRQLRIQIAGARQTAKLGQQGFVGRLQMVQLRLQIGHGDIGGELPGEQVPGQQGHHHQQDDRNDSDENVGDDQPVAQPPHQMLAQRAEAKQ